MFHSYFVSILNYIEDLTKQLASMSFIGLIVFNLIGLAFKVSNVIIDPIYENISRRYNG